MSESKPDAAAQLDAAVREIRAELAAAEGDGSLREEANFLGRAEALERLETGVLDRIEVWLDGGAVAAGSRDVLMALRGRAEDVRARLEAADVGLFRRLRSDIRRSGCMGREFREMLAPYLGPGILGSGSGAGAGTRGVGYDSLDAFFNGLLHSQPLPDETRPREPGMVYYQKTPARILLELAEAARLTAADTFYDVGSGLGQVAILIHLLTGAAARGIEVEPAYCGYARGCAEDLGLRGVEFLAVDARAADYRDGTAYFLYTPCEGRMLEEVLDRLRAQARAGSRLFTFGPCTAVTARREWARRGEGFGRDADGLGAFIIS